MAEPTYAMDSTHTTVYSGNAGSFSAFGGGPAGLQTETDYYILDENDGTPSCQSKDAWAGALRGMMHQHSGDLAVTGDGVAMIWTIYHVPNALTSRTASTEDGLSIRVGTSTSVNRFFSVGDGNSLLFETWVPWVVNWDMTQTSSYTGLNGTPSFAGTVDYIGASWDVSSSGPTKGAPAAIDAIRYGRMSLEYTDGQASQYATFGHAELTSNSTTNRWGVLEERSGVYFMQGFHSLGTSTTSVDFRDQDRVLFIRDTEFAPAGFNRIEVLNASSNVDWTNISITALGTQSRGTFVHTAGAFDADACQFIDMGTFTFLDASSATNCKFESCDTITAPGTDLTGSSVLTSRVAAGAGAVVWNVNQDPDGELDDMTFSKGTNAHHAVEFGANTPSSVTLRGWTVTGFNAANGNNDSVIYNNTGGALTVNVIGATGTISYRNGTGASTTIVTNPVTLSVHVQDIGTQADISGAQVFVPISASGSGWPYQASVSITSSGTTATVTHTGHGLSTNDYVFIEGVNENYYNGSHQITVSDANTYTYTLAATTTSPATGTITSTFVVISGTTDVNGDISASYSYTADQAISGRARYTGYRTGAVTGSIDSANGLSVTINLVSD